VLLFIDGRHMETHFAYVHVLRVTSINRTLKFAHINLTHVLQRHVPLVCVILSATESVGIAQWCHIGVDSLDQGVSV